MAKYKYRLVTKAGRVEEGVIEALTRGSVQRKLTKGKEGVTVLLVKREKKSIFSKQLKLPSFGMSKMEQITFFRNFASMISAGVSVLQSLEVLKKQSANRQVRKAIDHMVQDIKNGQSLSLAMGKFPKYFQRFLVELVHVGETSGELSEALERIAGTLERNYQLRRKVVGAIAYPAVIVFVMLIVITILITFVLPKISELYRELQAPLPLPTQALLSASDFVRSNPLVVLGILLALGLLFFIIYRSRKGRYAFHFLILKLPIFGPLAKEFNLARLFRALHTLLSSGIPLVKSVEVSKKTLKNIPYQQALDNVAPLLLHGSPLSEALEQTPFLFPEQSLKIIEVGERSGNVEQTFAHLTRHFESVVDHKTQMLTAMTEPVLMVIIGILVGGLALSIFLPIYQVSNVF